MTVGARATAPERIQVTYAAAAGCPGEDAFLADVALDGGRLVLARPDEPARSFALTLTADEGTGTARGRLIVRSLENVETRRDIEGAHCEDVARALAILVAVALLPTETPPVVPGSDASTTDDPTPDGDPTVTSPPPSASAPPVSPAPPLPPITPTPRPVRWREPLEREVEAIPPERRRWRIGAGVEGSLSSGMSAGAMPGYALYAELFHETPGAFAPALHLGFAKDGPTTSTKPSTLTIEGFPLMEGATSDRTVFRLDACPFRWLASQPWSRDAFSFLLCARGDVGRFRLNGGASFDQRWVDAGAVGRVRWAWPWCFVEFNASLVLPFARERFYGQSYVGEPVVDVFSVPAIAGAASLGTGVLFL